MTMENQSKDYFKFTGSQTGRWKSSIPGWTDSKPKASPDEEVSDNFYIRKWKEYVSKHFPNTEDAEFEVISSVLHK